MEYISYIQIDKSLALYITRHSFPRISVSLKFISFVLLNRTNYKYNRCKIVYILRKCKNTTAVKVQEAWREALSSI
jgi:hypothetical protein